MTAWLITGAAGMLGKEITHALAARKAIVTTADRSRLDITDAAAVADAVGGHDIVVNTAAWTDVDRAEDDEAAATAVNGDAVAHLARACATHGARLLHISTDYVFAGTASRPYLEDAPPAPINAYGRSKLAGEQAIRAHLPQNGYIVRTAWLYGQHGPNFVSTMLRLASQQDTVEVVNDQQGQPTWTRALAEQVVALGEAACRRHAPAGVYHGTATGTTTWYGLARAVFAGAGHDPDRVRPVNSQRFRRRAPRPSYSVLDHGRWAAAGVSAQPTWSQQLADALPTLSPHGRDR